jgi:prophage regulatory protein
VAQIEKQTTVVSQAPVDRLLKFSEVRSTLGLSKSTIYRLLQRGELPQPIKIGALTFFSERELQAWLAQKLATRRLGGCHDA